jgi:DNA adenine methylase
VATLSKLWRNHTHRRLVEPFCGGLAVTLGLRPDRALLNDINLHAINFYLWLTRGLKVGDRAPALNVPAVKGF